MSATTTTYDVRVRYMVDKTNTTSGLRDIGAAAESTASSVGGLGDKLKQLGAALTAYVGFRAGFDHLIKYNAELQNTTASLRTIIQLNSKGMSFGQAGAAANTLMAQFQTDVKEVPGTVQDLGEFASGISQAVLQAGGTVDDLRSITKDAFTAAKAMFPNMGSDMAALEVTETLMGNLTKRNRFGRGVMQAQGLESEQVNAMDPLERLNAFKKALHDPAIKDAQKGYLSSWAGVTSTFENTLKTTLGKVGLPLFQAISKEVLKWNDWVDNNATTISNFADTFKNALMTGFEYAKKIFGFISEHKDLLIALAKAAFVKNVVGGAVGMMSGAAAGVGGFLQNGFSGLTTNANTAALALGAFAAALSFTASMALDNQEKRMSTDIDVDALMREYTGAKAGKTVGFYKHLEEMHAIGKDGKVDFDALRQSGWAGSNLANHMESDGINGANALVGAGRDKLQARHLADFRASPDFQTAMNLTGHGRGAGHGQFGPMAGMFKQTINDVIGDLRRLRQPVDDLSKSLPMIGKWFLGGAFADDFNKLGKAYKPQVNIGKIVMNVESNDPDNFAIGMEGYFRAWTSNPTSSPNSVREGR